MIVIKTLEGTHRVGIGVTTSQPLTHPPEWRSVKDGDRRYSVKVRVYAAPSTPRGHRRAARKGKRGTK